MDRRRHRVLGPETQGRRWRILVRFSNDYDAGRNLRSGSGGGEQMAEGIFAGILQCYEDGIGFRIRRRIFPLNQLEAGPGEGPFKAGRPRRRFAQEENPRPAG